MELTYYVEQAVSEYLCDESLPPNVLIAALYTWCVHGAPSECYMVEKRENAVWIKARRNCLMTIDFLPSTPEKINALLKGGKWHFAIMARINAMLLDYSKKALADMTILAITLSPNA